MNSTKIGIFTGSILVISLICGALIANSKEARIITNNPVIEPTTLFERLAQ